MSGELDAAGAMATAGLAAGAVEGREAHEAGAGDCFNCGTPLNGRYCSNCGQAAHPHRSLLHVIEELLHSVFHFDTKAWRTLPMLIGRPGTLTHDYIFGKRARYISPLALFLLTVFFMFLVFSTAGPQLLNGSVHATPAQVEAELTEARADLAQARRDLTEAQGSHAGAAAEAALQAAVNGSEQRIAALRAASHSAPAASAPQQRWQDRLAEGARSGEIHSNSGWPLLDHRVHEALLNPDLALFKIQQAAYKWSFLLVPISLPFLAFLFLWKRGLTLYDHVVFSFYELSFVSLLFVAVTLAETTSWTEWLSLFLIVGLPIHTYFHMKGAYALGWWSALWRTIVMLFFAVIALSIFLLTILVVGLIE